MNTISRDQLFSLFKSEIHPQLAAALEKSAVTGLAVYENPEGRRTAVPTRGPKQAMELDDGFVLIAVYHKADLETSTTRTMAALDYLDKHPGSKPYAVAKMYGITPGAVYHAVKRRKGKLICPCCGQVVREGFVIEQN